jgi:hypothetical protein
VVARSLCSRPIPITSAVARRQRTNLNLLSSNEEAMAMVQGQPEHQVENGTASRGALDGMLKQRGYGRSGMLHVHVALSRCSSIWSQVQNGVLGARSDNTKTLKDVGLNWISSRDISLNRQCNRRVMLIEGDVIGQCSHP